MGVILENISYSYGDKAILDGINLNVGTGENVGVTGPSGCGKSTLLKLIAGLYMPDKGKLVVAGESEIEKIRKKVAIVMQSSILFPLSIRDNITCGHDIPAAKLREACETAQLTEWIDSLPEGLDTNVGERGGKVSGGQAQRIAIARAVAKGAEVILLDEPTSALDDETGSALISALYKLTMGKTVIKSSHRREALVGCDRIYSMSELQHR